MSEAPYHLVLDQGSYATKALVSDGHQPSKGCFVLLILRTLFFPITACG
jgi:hypothetical protein